jgi:hypothetical protein
VVGAGVPGEWEEDEQTGLEVRPGETAKESAAKAAALRQEMVDWQNYTQRQKDSLSGGVNTGKGDEGGKGGKRGGTGGKGGGTEGRQQGTPKGTPKASRGGSGRGAPAMPGRKNGAKGNTRSPPQPVGKRRSREGGERNNDNKLNSSPVARQSPRAKAKSTAAIYGAAGGGVTGSTAAEMGAGHAHVHSDGCNHTHGHPGGGGAPGMRHTHVPKGKLEKALAAAENAAASMLPGVQVGPPPASWALEQELAGEGGNT